MRRVAGWDAWGGRLGCVGWQAGMHGVAGCRRGYNVRHRYKGGEHLHEPDRYVPQQEEEERGQPRAEPHRLGAPAGRREHTVHYIVHYIRHYIVHYIVHYILHDIVLAWASRCRASGRRRGAAPPRHASARSRARGGARRARMRRPRGGCGRGRGTRTRWSRSRR